MRGYFLVDGGDISHPLPDGTLSRTTWREDGVPGMSYHDMITGDFISNRYEEGPPAEPDPSEMF